MNLRRIAKRLASSSLWITWHLAGLWVSLAMYYTSPLPYPLRGLLAVATFWLFVAAWRRTPRWRLAALAIGLVYTGYHFVLVRPDPAIAFDHDQAVMPQLSIDGDRVTVRNARRFVWHGKDDFTPGYYDTVFDAGRIKSMHYAVVPFGYTGGLAHVFLSFGFDDGQYVAVSIEARRPLGRAYSPVRSLFRQYQLIYVIGDERDILGLRGITTTARIQFYPARATPAAMRAIFLDLMNRADRLQDHPEFYNLATSNCMSNLLASLRKLPDLQLPSGMRLFLSGFSDRVAYELEYLDTTLPFDEACEAYRIDDRIRRHYGDADFSQTIR